MESSVIDQRKGKNAARRQVAYDRTRGWSLLRTRDFGLLWMGQIISQIGDGLTKVALIWFVYEPTGSRRYFWARPSGCTSIIFQRNGR
ncbi:MAG: hypothetical protein C4293_16565 [Nitrospiraceae bacterium]